MTLDIGNDQIPVYAVVGELYISLDQMENALEAFKRASEGASSEKAYFRLAQLYYQKNKFREASVAARKAYDIDQKPPEHVALLAKSLLRIGRGKEAIDLYRKALNIKDSDAANDAAIMSPLIFDYAEALVFSGNYDEAIKRLDPILKRANRDNPLYLRSIEIVSDALRRSGKREEAVSRIEEAIKGQDVSESLSLLYNLAETFEEMQQFDKAIETYEEALRAILNPDGTIGERPQERQNAGVILRRISLAYRTSGKRDKAVETIERMRKVLGDKSPLADQLQLGVLLDEGKYTDVVQGAKAAAVRHPDERSFKYLEAQAAARLGDLKTAEATLQSLMKGGHEDVEVQLFLSSIQLDSNQLKQAEETARKAAAMDPNDIGPLVTLSTVQERQKKYKESEVTLRKALEIDPDNATLLNNLGYFLADRNERLTEAEELIRRAVNIDPTNGSFLDSLGWLLFRQGKLEEAEKYLEQAIIYSPRSVTIQDHLGDVYKKLGKTEKARAAWETALKLGVELKFSSNPEELGRIKQKLGRK
jgi:tetratricopeptide (TPR) repeat protein